MKPYKLILLTIACSWAMAASAQWQWLDKDGRKVFSDRPPPMDVPQKNILKEPGNGGKSRAANTAPAPAPASNSDAQAAAASAPASAPALPLGSGKDKLLEENKAKADAAEAAKKKAEAERAAKVRAENCARAQKAKARLTSGQLVGHVNEKGERGFMDDATREAELKRADQNIATECGPAPAAQ